MGRSSTVRSGTVADCCFDTQVYANGTQDRFEGVFMNRSAFDSPTDKGTTVFGLGVVGKEIGIAGVTINKFFYERK